MNDFNFFLKKIWDWIEHIISIIASIVGILCFFGIDYNKVKPFIQSLSRKIKIFAYKITTEIICICKDIKTILYRRLSKITNDFTISQVAAVFTIVSLVGIILLVPVVYPIKESNEKVRIENSDFNQIVFNNDREYFALNNINDQPREKAIEQIISDRLEIEELKDLYDSVFYFSTNENYLEKTIINEIEILRNSCKENISLNKEVSSYAHFYSEMEADLFNNNDEPLQFDLLDEIIEGREELFKLYPNKTLAWLLANSYQAYAYNSLKQTNEDSNILYYYLQSIYYAKISLEFDMDAEDKEMRIKYIQKRYKDIADCKAIDDEMRLRAYEVYHAIDNALTILNMGNLSPDEVEKW